MLLRVLIQEAHIDTNATLRKIYTQVQDLPNYMTSVQHNITKFNLHVESLIAQLNARGKEAPELLTSLFIAYQVVPDERFVRFIESKENDYDYGAPMSAQELMQVAMTMYQTRVETGKWAAPSSEKAEIEALKTELVQLKKQSKKAKTTNFNKKEKPKKFKGPAWKKTPPTEEERKNGTKKKVNEKWFYWCPQHEMWTLHKPEECKGIKFGKKYGAERKAQQKKQHQPQPTQTVHETVIAPYNQQEVQSDEE